VTRLFAILRRRGLLLKHDAELPSATALIAGGAIRGSWWGHPKGGKIFRALEDAADHPDVAVVKLVAGKDTFVHRRLWPALITIATCRQDWQLAGLSSAGKRALAQVEREGTLEATGNPKSAIRELEERLLCRSEQFHTAKGRHEKRLESWPHWAKRARLPACALPVERAMERLEQALPGAQWPWSAR
jgi:hypothetical protein